MNRTMAIKHAKARRMACEEYKYHALAESVSDIIEGRFVLPVDSRSMPKGKVKRGLIAIDNNLKTISPLIEEWARKELGL